MTYLTHPLNSVQHSNSGWCILFICSCCFPTAFSSQREAGIFQGIQICKVGSSLFEKGWVRFRAEQVVQLVSNFTLSFVSGQLLPPLQALPTSTHWTTQFEESIRKLHQKPSHYATHRYKGSDLHVKQIQCSKFKFRKRKKSSSLLLGVGEIMVELVYLKQE